MTLRFLFVSFHLLLAGFNLSIPAAQHYREACIAAPHTFAKLRAKAFRVDHHMASAFCNRKISFGTIIQKGIRIFGWNLYLALLKGPKKGIGFRLYPRLHCGMKTVLIHDVVGILNGSIADTSLEIFSFDFWH
ncbi:hypothetical protein F5Y16DRAFT_369443 [Xylariaceae sp. FL0255]|nr:hypothetical protein F5Y16DRAFT_369443 [Xylariaceae sp. FL0255]